MQEEVVSKNVESTQDEAVEETKAYLTLIAKEMKIDDLTIHTEQNGKYVTFDWKVKKQLYLLENADKR